MTPKSTWTSRLVAARAADHSAEAALTAQMIRAAPPEAMTAAMASFDAPSTLAAALDHPAQRRMTLWLRLRTWRLRLIHRLTEDAIAANNELCAQGNRRAIFSNAHDTIRLMFVADCLAQLGVPEAARSMGNRELLLSLLLAIFAAGGSLIYGLAQHAFGATA